jgi:hypothetical protein
LNLVIFLLFFRIGTALWFFPGGKPWSKESAVPIVGSLSAVIPEYAIRDIAVQWRVKKRGKLNGRNKKWPRTPTIERHSEIMYANGKSAIPVTGKATGRTIPPNPNAIDFCSAGETAREGALRRLQKATRQATLRP